MNKAGECRHHLHRSQCGAGNGSTPGRMALTAANSAIGFLLVVIIAVLCSFLSFIFYLAKRAKMVAEEEVIESGK